MFKSSKEHCRYQSAFKAERCGTCAHMAPDGDCEVVEGKVTSNMWCVLFHPAKGHSR